MAESKKRKRNEDNTSRKKPKLHRLMVFENAGFYTRLIELSPSDPGLFDLPKDVIPLLLDPKVIYAMARKNPEHYVIGSKKGYPKPITAHTSPYNRETVLRTVIQTKCRLARTCNALNIKFGFSSRRKEIQFIFCEFAMACMGESHISKMKEDFQEYTENDQDDASYIGLLRRVRKNARIKMNIQEKSKRAAVAIAYSALLRQEPRTKVSLKPVYTKKHKRN